ncbi:hypothetical protein [uncultured Jannaschia sp.]|uniref:hypothetical protein n=1 Tax=uncultured Jannaschia sp. TaxID=293347 RepID=UPI00260EC171|nr:hypothetical protein [uncultured Jannaschia sp.]
MNSIGHVLLLAALFALEAGAAAAQGYSLLGKGGLHGARPPLFVETSLGDTARPLIRSRAEIPDSAEAEERRGHAQSLFIGQARRGLFAPRPSPGDVHAYGPILGGDRHAEMIRHLIARAEAGPEGYDAVQYGARVRPARRPTEMTLGEVFAWIDATPGQPHAIGRYQFIPSTLARLVTILDAGPDERFSPRMQDRLADILLQDAGLDAFRADEITRHQLMNNLARIWAGLPNASGRSHYHGYAGNAATMTWSAFDSEMTRIFQS